MSLRELLENAVAGSAYGLTAVVVSHPFDTVKTKQQAEPRFQFAGPFRTAFLTVQADGVLALYCGFAAAAAGSMAFRALPFAAYGFTSAHLKRTCSWWERHPIVLASVAGSSGGLIRSVVECPLEVAKVRRQVGVAWRWSSMYHGLAVTVFRNMSVIGLFWGFVQASAPLREALTDSPDTRSFLAGGGCSAAAWLVVYPADMAKSRVQSFATSGSQAPHAVRVLADVARSSGVAALYSGLSAGLLRAIFANGVAFVVYDKVLADWRKASAPSL